MSVNEHVKKMTCVKQTLLKLRRDEHDDDTNTNFKVLTLHMFSVAYGLVVYINIYVYIK